MKNQPSKKSGIPDLRSMTFEEISSYVATLGEPSYRAGQLYEWLHVKKAAAFSEMSNLPKGLRSRLEEETALATLRIRTVQQSKEDGTRKYLFELADGHYVESVLLRYHHGNSVCVSSQVGCRMGCGFCASTIGGVERNLSAGEILEQIYRIEADIAERVSHIVIMGMGEPLDNYDAVLRFLRMVTDENGAHISARNITLSTCGLVPRIYDLAGERLGITLAISLHASNQKKREALMPVARRYSLDELLRACRHYFTVTGRRVTFEYTLIAGENDRKEDAAELSRLLSDMHAHVNLIPVNPVTERGYLPPDHRAAGAFAARLEKYGINVTIRKSMGRDIDGACGQLRKRYER